MTLRAVSVGSFSGVLFLVFLILKLTKVIAWSWWWVTAPLWISALGDCILIIAALGALVVIEHKINRSKLKVRTA